MRTLPRIHLSQILTCHVLFHLPIGGRRGCTLGGDGALFCILVSLFSFCLSFVLFLNIPFSLFYFTSPLEVDAVAHWAVTVRSPDTRTRPRSEASIPGHVLEMKIWEKSSYCKWKYCEHESLHILCTSSKWKFKRIVDTTNGNIVNMKVFESWARPGKCLKIWSIFYKGSYINYVIAIRE